jgi:hypothetical protein
MKFNFERMLFEDQAKPFYLIFIANGLIIIIGSGIHTTIFALLKTDLLTFDLNRR